MRKTLSFDKGKMNVLLLEGVHPVAAELLKEDGYTAIEVRSQAIEPLELKRVLSDVHLLGIRSRTQVTQDIIRSAPKLLAIGCFCIGTDNVDLSAAGLAGIPVFNAPFSNTRSVAELTIGNIIALLRRVPEKNEALHRGVWLKNADGCFEVRGKTLGIVGYGRIGSQVGILAEALGMRVIFYDIERKLGIGNARQCKSLTTLLGESDVVTLHVQGGESTKHMIHAAAIRKMKRGAILLNIARGSVVDIDAVREAILSGHIAGAALDVFPVEPTSKDQEFLCPLRGMPSVILTPHIGASTVEAQRNIGIEVAEKLITYVSNGSTISAVNIPEVNLPAHEGRHRLLHIHRNVPGMLASVNQVFSSLAINIASQYLNTRGEIGYVVIDVDEGAAADALVAMKAIPGTVKARVLY